MAWESDYSDSELLRNVSLDDQQAFRVIFHRYFDRLFRFLLNMVKSKEVAEELAMDVFTKMWLARDMMTEVENLNGFLFRVAYHKALDFFRAAEKDRRLNDAIGKMAGVPSENQAEAALSVQEYETLLRQAVDLLPAKRKQIFLLRQDDGLTPGEIADRLGISKNTVANTLVEARQFIRAYLAKRMDLVALLTVVYPLLEKF